jgi:hypothetical protein
MKLHWPVAFCTKCGFVTRNDGFINQPCPQMVKRSRVRCDGVFQSRLNQDGWTECPTCAATGVNNNQPCGTCRGVGWYPIRLPK